MKELTVFFLLVLSAGGMVSALSIIELRDEIQALNKRLDDKTLLCIKTGEIKSRHNIVLDCSEVK